MTIQSQFHYMGPNEKDYFQITRNPTLKNLNFIMNNLSSKLNYARTGLKGEYATMAQSVGSLMGNMNCSINPS